MKKRKGAGGTLHPPGSPAVLQKCNFTELKNFTTKTLMLLTKTLSKFSTLPEVLDGFLFKIQKLDEGCFVIFERNVGVETPTHNVFK